MGPLLCSAQVDSIGKRCLEINKHLYTYKGKVKIPPLGMIDDIAAVKPYCPDLFVDQWKLEKVEKAEYGIKSLVDVEGDEFMMENSVEEKYSGEILTNSGDIIANIRARRSRGIAVVNQICSIIEDICLGHYLFEALVTLRGAMLINSMLSNSEAWYGIKEKDLKELEKVDEILMRRVFKTPSTTSSIILYLELGVSPIRFILISRQWMFLHYILNEDPESVLSKFFYCQANNPLKGDRVITAEENLSFINMSNYKFEDIKQMSKNKFKKIVHQAVNLKAFQYLIEKKGSQSKIKKPTILTAQYAAIFEV